MSHGINLPHIHENPDQAALELGAAQSAAQLELEDMAGANTSIAHLALANKRHEIATGVANFQIVKGLLDVLPHSEYDEWSGGVVQASDPLEVRRILAATIFWRGDFAMYIIGENPQPNPKWTDILLAKQYAVGSDPSIMKTTVKTAALERNKAAAASHMSRSYSPEEIEPMLDEETGRYVISGDTAPGAALIGGRDTKGGRFSGVPSHEDVVAGQVPEELWQKFNVTAQLGSLATIFGKDAVLYELLVNRNVAYEPSPVEAFVSGRTTLEKS